MKRWHLFSWVKPAVEDFHYERDAKELHIKKRIIDLTGGGTGILKGVDDEIEVYVDNPAQFLVVKVKTGEAYIQGEKIEITNVQTVTLDDVETEANIVYLKYKLIDSGESSATRQHPISGEPHIVWKDDSFELIAVKESQYIQTDDKLKLVRVAKVGSDLTITHDYRTYLKIDSDRWPNYVNESEFYVGGPEGTGTKVLKQQAAPPVPNYLDLSTGWDDAYRKTGESAGLVSHRPAYIKAEFGDKGQGTASGITFTKTTNRVGAWTVDEWIGYYLTCADGNSWKVVSNTSDTLTLEATAVPITGNFWLGPNAAGYKLIIETLDPSTEEIVATAEAEAQAMESPVKMEFIWPGLTADVKYQVKVASKGGWFQEEWSGFCTPKSIIAGGPKEIPDLCADVIDGDVTITADDDGVRINWAVKSEYAAKVSGFELCWTDDGSSDPDFNNKNHRKIFTDRNHAVLPARMSSETTTVKVKAKMRAVDKAGRHCVTPKTLTDTDTKKYPGDLSSLVTDIKSIITPGDFPTLKSFFERSINLEDGRGRMVTEFESQMDDLRSNYKSPGEHLRAVLRAGVDWHYVRIVAKDESGHYSSWQAAIDSIPTNATESWWTILIMPGEYNEAIEIPAGVEYSLSFIGVGKVILNGSVRSLDTDNAVRISKIEDIRFLQEAAPTGAYPCITVKSNPVLSTIRNCDFLSNASNSAVYPLRILGVDGLVINNVVMRSRHECIKLAGNSEKYVKLQNCHLYSWDNSKNAIYLDNPGIDYGLYVRDSDLRTDTGVECINAAPGYQANNIVKMRHCGYVVAPNGSNLTVDYGTADNQTNVIFDPGDFFVQYEEA
ncbi:MAG: hypothetical protein WBB37_07645 [bacterium]